mmetsp:Transcript_8085/g.13722  ORF Transcript_8085/g.13722 Transcript_8085/m.13722 type:complete len:89 (-) Transcript_8085:153-419(-)
MKSVLSAAHLSTAVFVSTSGPPRYEGAARTTDGPPRGATAGHRSRLQPVRAAGARGRRQQQEAALRAVISANVPLLVAIALTLRSQVL